MGQIDKKTGSIIVDGIVTAVIALLGIGVKVGGNEIKKNIGKDKK